jgi:hypothetical protein
MRSGRRPNARERTEPHPGDVRRLGRRPGRTGLACPGAGPTTARVSGADWYSQASTADGRAARRELLSGAAPSFVGRGGVVEKSERERIRDFLRWTDGSCP